MCCALTTVVPSPPCISPFLPSHNSTLSTHSAARCHLIPRGYLSSPHISLPYTQAAEEDGQGGDLCRWIKSLMPLTKPARVPRRGGGFSISNACLAARSESSTILCARTCTVQYMPCLREHARSFRLVWTEGGPGVMSVSGTYRGCPMFMHACA